MNPIAITCEKKSEEALKKHPDVLAAFSGARYPKNKSAAKAMKMLQKVKCDNAEILYLVDSDISLNGIHVAKTIPEYLRVRSIQTWRLSEVREWYRSQA